MSNPATISIPVFIVNYRKAMEKLAAADVAFRHQLEMKEASQQEKIAQLELDKQQEVELANQKVECDVIIFVSSPNVVLRNCLAKLYY